MKYHALFVIFEKSANLLQIIEGALRVNNNHKFTSIICLTLCLMHLLIFFQNQLSQKILSGMPSECQTVCIQIRLNVLLGRIWFQTVCKSYQQTTLVGKELPEPTRPLSKQLP